MNTIYKDNVTISWKFPDFKQSINPFPIDLKKFIMLRSNNVLTQPSITRNSTTLEGLNSNINIVTISYAYVHNCECKNSMRDLKIPVRKFISELIKYVVILIKDQ